MQYLGRNLALRVVVALSSLQFVLSHPKSSFRAACNSTNGGHLVSGVMGLGCVFAVLAAVVEYRARRMESDLRILQNEDMIRRLGSSDFTPY